MIYSARTGDPSYFKCSCQNCGKHIEFPSNGAGMAVPCPHCGKQTVLGVSDSAPTAGKSKKVLWVTLVLMVVIAGVVVAFMWPRTPKPQPIPNGQKAVAVAVVPVANTNKVVSQPVSEPAPAADTINDFDVSKISLQKQPGSSLVYAVGTLKNTAARQRFGVRIELNQLDESDKNVGVISDYVSVVDPQKSWQFKAVLTSRYVAKVTVAGIKEQQ
jgi:hypothetical protein